MKANRRARWIVSATLFSFLLTVVTVLSPPRAIPQAGTDGEVLLSTADDGRRVELRADQYLTLRLEANPAAGYGWYVQDLDTEVLRQAGEPEMDATPPLLGAPTTVTLRFSPHAAGESPLLLVYGRPWEEEPLKTFSLRVASAGAYVGNEALEAEARAEALPVAPESAAAADLPAALNWCTAVGCTPVRDQGACGSCWAFATAGVLEQNIRLVDGVGKNLSEQYLLSCNTEGWSCSGGWWAHDYNWWKVPPGEPGPGAVYEAAFPYVARKVACNPPHTHYEKIDDWQYVGTASGVPTVAALKQAIYERGPVAVAVCVGSRFTNYTGGVLTTGDVCDKAVNHGVILVGWDDSLGAGGAWILRNSWGPGWGEGGYMKIAYGIANVGYGATYVVRGTMPLKPLAPGNLKAVARTTSRIDLSWSDNSNNESGFRIERSPNGTTGWQQIATVSANVRAWSDTGLAPATVTYYRVQAYNTYGGSPYSNVALGMTWPDPSQLDERFYLPLLRRSSRQ